MPKNGDVKSWQGFERYIWSHESDHTSKKFNANMHGSIAILLRFFKKDFPEHITSKPSIIMSHTAVVCMYLHTKRFGAPALSKDKRKAKGRAIRTGIQQLFNMLFNSKLTR